MQQKWIWWALPLLLLGAFVLWQMGDESAPRAAPESQSDEPGNESWLADFVAQEIVLEGSPDLKGNAPAAEPRVETPRAGPATTTRFHGLVVDEEQSPVAGARVEIRWDPSLVRTVSTNAKGIYEFELGSALLPQTGSALAVARTDDGRVGWTMFSFRPRGGVEDGSDIAIPKLVLKPAHELVVEVDSTCPDAFPAKVWVHSAMWSMAPSLLTTTTDAAGRAVLSNLPEGQWLLHVASEGCGRAWTVISTPRPTRDPVTLTLPVAHALTVTVLETGSETPIAGATINVSESMRMPGYFRRGKLVTVPSVYTTDATGMVRIAGLAGTEKLQLYVTADGYPTGSEHNRTGRNAPGVARLKEGASEATIHLSPPLTVRWPLKDEGLGIPPDGTTVTLKPWTNSGRRTVPASGVVEQGELVVEGWSTDGAAAYAVWDDKGIARLRAQPGKTEGHPTGFFPLRTITLEARHADGTPVVGWYLMVKDGGNNPVAPPVRTDEEGRAVMTGLYGGDRFGVGVSLQELASYGGHVQRLGTVKVIEKDGVFEAVVPDTRTLHIRLVGKDADLPDDFRASARINYQYVKPDEESSDPTLLIAKIRPHAPGAEVRVGILARGWVTRPQTIRLSDHPDPVELTFELRRTSSVHVRILEPKDKRHKVQLQQWNEGSRSWQPGLAYDNPSVKVDRAPFEGGIQPFHFMAPGRYRAVEYYSRLIGDPFDLQSGKTAQATMDLREAGYVRGTVSVPEGASLAGLHVGPVDHALPTGQLIFPADRSLSNALVPVDAKTGAFQYRVAGTKDVTLRTYHQSLRPHPIQGHIAVRGPQEGIELAAIAGGIATVRLSRAPMIQLNPGRPRRITVRLYKGDVKGEGQVLHGQLDGTHTTVTFGGYQPGTWTVWIDVPSSAPLVLKAQSLGEGDADLGIVGLQAGSRLRLDIKAKEGASPPSLTIFAQKLDEPTYTRRFDSTGDKATLEGIGPGRFRISALTQGGGVGALIEEIEFDGESEVVRTFDAR